MQCLIDGDVLRYEIGFAAEAGWQQAGFPPFDYVADLLHNKIDNICAITESTEKPIIYLTGKLNFRNEIAKLVPYKQRASNKPWHFRNLSAYLNAVFDVRLQEGLEADDLMAIEQTSRLGTDKPTIICTRDKDLRAVPGWHYGWELGNQPQFGPELVNHDGYVRLSGDRKSIKGTGLLFFYAQCLTGDAVDTIPGLPRCGAVAAFKLLEGVDSQEAFKRVLGAYRGVYKDSAEERLLEQGRLLWMTRKLHPDGSPVLWELPDVQ